jgi:hypothetical protein
MTLHERTADGGTFSVAIECNFETSTLTVHVQDRHGKWTLHPNDGREAMDMFHHPYAYTPVDVARLSRYEPVNA